MSAEFPESPQELLEARLTALILGELPAPDAAELQKAIAASAELSGLHDRLKRTIQFVREASVSTSEKDLSQPQPLRLSPQKREELLGLFKVVATPGMASGAQRSHRGRMPGTLGTILRGLRMPTAIAAAIMALLGVVAMIIPNFVKAKSMRSQRASMAEVKMAESLAAYATGAKQESADNEQRLKLGVGFETATKVRSLASLSDGALRGGEAGGFGVAAATTPTPPASGGALYLPVAPAEGQISTDFKEEAKTEATSPTSGGLRGEAVSEVLRAQSGQTLQGSDQNWAWFGNGRQIGTERKVRAEGALSVNGPVGQVVALGTAGVGASMSLFDAEQARGQQEIGRLGESVAKQEQERLEPLPLKLPAPTFKGTPVDASGLSASTGRPLAAGQGTGGPATSASDRASASSTALPGASAGVGSPATLTRNQYFSKIETREDLARAYETEVARKPLAATAPVLGDEPALGRSFKPVRLDAQPLGMASATDAMRRSSKDALGTSASVPDGLALANTDFFAKSKAVDHYDLALGDVVANSSAAESVNKTIPPPAGPESRKSGAQPKAQSELTPVASHWDNHGLAWSDFDNDGDLDAALLRAIPEKPAAAAPAKTDDSNRRAYRYSLADTERFLHYEQAGRVVQPQQGLSRGSVIAGGVRGSSLSDDASRFQGPAPGSEAKQAGILGSQEIRNSEALAGKKVLIELPKLADQSSARHDEKAEVMDTVALGHGVFQTDGDGAPASRESVTRGRVSPRPSATSASLAGQGLGTDASAPTAVPSPSSGGRGITQATPAAPAAQPTAAPSQEARQLAEADVAARRATNAPIPQPENSTSENAFSTFSLNVTDVSFKLAAASLEKNTMPDPTTVRSEEFINAFDYRDAEPPPGVPVGFTWERCGHPTAHNRDLLRLSIKTAAQGREPNRPLNLVVLLDNSGSMERADRVRIIQESLRVLAAQMKPLDRLSVVAFARTARLVVDGVPGDQAGTAAERVGQLPPQGGTHLEEAMNLAYATAARHFLSGGVNRVVLLTDGAANLGDVEPASLKRTVEQRRQQGIALDCFGIGWEGYNDDLLEELSRHGDGRYGFVNTPEAASTEFAAQLAGALRVAASDVKAQVEFNPDRVAAWRQIGYAKHQLKKEQFRDNTVDAAELGAAEAGNALYVVQVKPDGEGPLAVVRVRFKVPGTLDFKEMEWPVRYTSVATPLEKASPAMRLAATAAGFSEWLAASPYAAEVTCDQLLRQLNGVLEAFGADARPRKLEWMIRQAKSLSGR